MNPPIAESVRGLRLICLPLMLAYLLWYASGLRWLAGFVRDRELYILGRDFLNFWMAGKAAFAEDPAAYYDRLFYARTLGTIAGQGYEQVMSYPPTIMLVAAPFGLLPYHMAWLLWTVAGLWLLWRVTAREDRASAVVLMLSPAVLLCVICGQNALFSAVLILLVFRWMDVRPVCAGLLLGLLTLKPQLGLLFPVLLLASRRWSVLVTASITAAGLLGLSALLLGPDVITAYLQEGMATQRTVLLEADDMLRLMMSTPFIDMKIAGLDTQPALVVQTCCSLAMAAVVGWVFCRRRDALLSFAIFVAASVVATPYLMGYDLVVLSWVSLLVLQMPELSKRGRMIALLNFALPLVRFFTGVAAIPGASLVPMAMVVWCIIELRRRATD